MPQADIEINAVASSSEGVPIDTLVQLSNNDVGDESTYDWTIVNQPPGAADGLSSAVIENPVITPKKEDTYLIKLVVDEGLPGESTDIKLFRVRRFKTDAALVAVTESIEGTQAAWSFLQNETLSKILNHLYDGEVIVALATGPLTTGAAVQLNNIGTIKATLPGEERVPVANQIDATDVNITDKMVGIAIGQPDGNPTVIANDMVLVRMTGLLDISSAGAPTLGDDVFIDDTGVLALVPGTTTKKVGVVIDATPGAWRPYLSTLSFDPRGPKGPAGGDLAGTYPNPTIPDPSTLTSVAGITSFSGALDTLVAGMTVTPAAGTYLVYFIGSVENSANGTTIFTSIFSGGAKDLPSEQIWRRAGNNIQASFTCVAKVVVNGFQAIEGKWRTTGGTAFIENRSLLIVKVD